MKPEDKKEYVKVDKESFDWLLHGVLKLNEMKCSFCSLKITKDNFGLIAKDFYSCNNFGCIFKAVRRFEKEKFEEEEKK